MKNKIIFAILACIVAVALSILIVPTVVGASEKDDWIEKLAKCESRGRSHITILDSNNKYSYGLLQFQLDTFISFGKKYEILPDEFTRKESLLLIHNPNVQKAIAKEMLDDGLSGHWRNCVRKIGQYPLYNSLTLND